MGLFFRYCCFKAFTLHERTVKGLLGVTGATADGEEVVIVTVSGKVADGVGTSLASVKIYRSVSIQTRL